MYKDGLHEHSRLEDEYFYKKDRELIEKNKKETQQKKELLERTAHYHKCAKCGHDMEELVRDQISLLMCTGCECVHLSRETLESLGQHGRLRSLTNEMRDFFVQLKKSA